MRLIGDRHLHLIFTLDLRSKKGYKNVKRCIYLFNKSLTEINHFIAITSTTTKHFQDLRKEE